MKTHKIFCSAFLIACLAIMSISCKKVEKGTIKLSAEALEIPQSGGMEFTDCYDGRIVLDAVEISHDKEQWQTLRVDEDLQATYTNENKCGIIELKNDMIDINVIETDSGLCRITVELSENLASLPNYYRVFVTNHVIMGSFTIHQSSR